MASGIDFDREDWGARAPRYVIARPTYPVTHVFIHHGAVAAGDTVPEEMATVRGYQRFHMDSRGWSDIAYGILVGRSGSSYEGRGWRRQGGATGSPQDTFSLSICAIGNFEAQRPTREMLDKIVSTIVHGMRNGHIRPDARIVGHRDKPYGTACPGRYLYAELDFIRSEVARIMGGGVPGGIDVIPFEDWRRHYNNVEHFAPADGVVTFVQDRLNRLGYETGVDGVKGPDTDESVVAFKVDREHSTTVTFGRPAWESLLDVVEEVEVEVEVPVEVPADFPPHLSTSLEEAARAIKVAENEVGKARFIVNAGG